MTMTPLRVVVVVVFSVFVASIATLEFEEYSEDSINIDDGIFPEADIPVEDERLEKRSKECGPPRPRNKDANYGKSCPGNVGYDQKKDRNLIGLFNLNAKNPKCLNGNKGYPSLREAWKACGKIPECGFILKDVVNYYYLRRWSDPNMEVDPRVWGYNYYCHPTPPARKAIANCPKKRVNFGRNCAKNACLDLMGFPTLDEAWEKCGKVPDCDFIMRYNSKYYYLKRSSDPKYTHKDRFGKTDTWGYNFKCEGCNPACVHGKCVNKKCQCDQGYFGTTCAEKGCNAGCVHGTCGDDACHAECHGTCLCHPGYYGKRCDSTRRPLIG